MCNTVHIRVYNFKSHWKGQHVQCHNFTHWNQGIGISQLNFLSWISCMALMTWMRHHWCPKCGLSDQGLQYLRKSSCNNLQYRMSRYRTVRAWFCTLLVYEENFCVMSSKMLACCAQSWTYGVNFAKFALELEALRFHVRFSTRGH